MNMKLYNDIIIEYSNDKFEWDRLKNKVIIFSGITGLVGKFFVDLIMYKNYKDDLNCTIVGICRNEKKLVDMFEEYLSNKNFKYLIKNILFMQLVILILFNMQQILLVRLIVMLAEHLIY